MVLKDSALDGGWRSFLLGSKVQRNVLCSGFMFEETFLLEGTR